MARAAVLAAAVALLPCTCARAPAAAAPYVPTQYTVNRGWTECGDAPGPCAHQDEVFAFDAVRQREAVSRAEPGGAFAVTLTAGDLGLTFEWTTAGESGAPQGCVTSRTSAQFPFHGEYDWLRLNSTKAVGRVECPPGPPNGGTLQAAAAAASGECLLWAGEWPAEVTAIAQLWYPAAEASDGPRLPVQEHLVCSIFPFQLFYTYRNWTLGPPPASSLDVPVSCPKTPTGPPRSVFARRYRQPRAAPPLRGTAALERR